MAEPADAAELQPEELSSDAWLGGRLTLIQPRRGHRAGTDAALLAAAADFSECRFADVGAGVGAVGLAILSRCERASADLVEIDAGLAALAGDNASRNGLAGRTRVLPLDICDARARREAGLDAGSVGAVVTNPPFFEAGAVRASPDRARARAHVFAGEAGVDPLVAWIRACLAILKPGGRFVMIHRPDALPAIVGAAENRLGAVALLPVHPRAGAVRPPAARLGDKGLESAAPDRARVDPA